MPARFSLRNLLATLGASALLLLLTFAAGVAAQDATPTPTPAPAGYPVSIHAGTCDDPVAQPIGPTLATEVAGIDGGERVGVSAAPPLQVASGTVDGAMADLTSTPHVVAVHASADDYGTIVACGEIAGYADDGRLAIALRGVNASGISGVAIVDDQPSFLDNVLADLDLDLGTGKLSLTVLVIPPAEAAGA